MTRGTSGGATLGRAIVRYGFRRGRGSTSAVRTGREHPPLAHAFPRGRRRWRGGLVVRGQRVRRNRIVLAVVRLGVLDLAVVVKRARRSRLRALNEQLLLSRRAGRRC